MDWILDPRAMETHNKVNIERKKLIERNQRLLDQVRCQWRTTIHIPGTGRVVRITDDLAATADGWECEDCRVAASNEELDRVAEWLRTRPYDINGKRRRFKHRLRKDTDSSLLRQLRQEIENRAISRYRIAREVDIDAGHLSRFMHGQAGLSIENAERLADFLNMSVVLQPLTCQKNGSPI